VLKLVGDGSRGTGLQSTGPGRGEFQLMDGLGRCSLEVDEGACGWFVRVSMLFVCGLSCLAPIVPRGEALEYGCGFFAVWAGARFIR